MESATSRFGEWLVAACAAKGWDMATLADQAGVARSTLSMLRPPSERVPSPATCRKLARALGVADALVLEIAGHIQSQDVRRSLHAVTGQAILEHRDPDSGHVSALPLPERLLPADSVEIAKLAVHNIPTERLSEESKWRVLALIDALTTAQQIESQQPHQEGPNQGLSQEANGADCDSDASLDIQSGDLPRLPRLPHLYHEK